jgi:hypothetical protein
MQPERQISVALTAVSAALVLPAFLALAHHPNAAPGASLAIGAAIGALGVLFGSLVGMDHSVAVVRAISLGFWSVIALALSGATWFGAAHSASWGGRIVFGITGFLPLAGPILVLRRRHAT